MKKSLVIMAALCAAHSPAIAQSVAPDAEVPWDTSGRLYLFGDSRTDSGSGGGLTGNGQPQNYFNGRRSNGPLYWEYTYPNKTLAVDVFMNNLVGSTSDGINFAMGGNTVLPGRFGNLANQTDRYGQLVNSNTISAPSANDTFTIFMGQGGDNTLALAEIKRNVNNLVELGAKRFIIIGTSSFASAPDGGVIGAEYNTGLKAMARDMISNGATVMYIDAGFAPVINDILANSSIYGVQDATRFCRPTFTTSNCPSDYFWWDPGHFTTNVNKIFGAYVSATATNINYTAGTYAQLLNTTYQVHRDTVDLISSNALSQSGSDFSIYGFTRYNTGHADAQSLSSRADYSGYSMGIGAYVPLSDQLSIGLSGSYYDGDTGVAGPVGVSGKSEAYDGAANLTWRNGGTYAMVMGGAGRHKLNLTRATSFEWRPTVQSSPSIDTTFASLEAGTKMKLGGVSFTPFGRVDFANFKMNRVQETGVFFGSDVSETRLESWQVSGGLKAEVPLSNNFNLGVTGSVARELSGDTQVSALIDTFNYSYANLDMGRGVEARGAVNLSGQIWKSVSARVEVGGRTGKLASDGYVQAGVTIPF
jgi:phospholipase/lecithinase/hemolysin